MDLMIEMVIGVGLVAATSVLFGVVLMAYLRMRNSRLLFVALGFGSFFVGAFLYLVEILIPDLGLMITTNVIMIFQLVGLIFIAVGVLKD